MRFAVDPALALFASSVRGAIGAWEPPREPELGSWWDERDDELAARLQEVGWAELWASRELLGAAVAGAIELGRGLAPLSLVDEATLGAPLAVAGRARHAAGSAQVAQVGGGCTVAHVAVAGAEHEATLDGTGTVRLDPQAGDAVADGHDRLRAWGAATLGYVAGVCAHAVDGAVRHVTGREQFGAPLGALPAVQARLADAALAADGVALVAWAAAARDAADDPLPRAEVLWAGAAAREVTASALQVHGAIGFALESGVHRAFRRAASLQSWGEAVVRATGEPGPA